MYAVAIKTNSARLLKQYVCLFFVVALIISASVPLLTAQREEGKDVPYVLAGVNAQK